MNIRKHFFVFALFLLPISGILEAQDWELIRAGAATGVAVLPDDVLLAVINGYADRSTDAGVTWIRGGVGPGNATAIRVKNGNEIYAGTPFGLPGLTFSTDGGIQWQYYPNIRAWDVAFNSLGHIFVATEGDEVVRSTDNGASWTLHEVDEQGGAYYWSIAIDGHDNIYTGAQGEGAYRSTDNGETWAPLLQHARMIVDGITVARDGTIYVSGSGGLQVTQGPTPLVGFYRSTDNGVTWEDISSEDSVYVGKRMVINSSGTLFVAATHKGDPNSVVLKSTDRGDTWQRLSEGKAWGYIYGIALDSHERIFIASASGVYSLRETSAAPEMPNPFAQENVSFITGPEGSGSYIRVKSDGSPGSHLQLIDMNGREVGNIPLEALTSGEHRFNVSDLDLPQGVYLCRYMNGEKTQVVKLIAR